MIANPPSRGTFQHSDDGRLATLADVMIERFGARAWSVAEHQAELVGPDRPELSDRWAAVAALINERSA